jgi:hypothetical protein
MAVGKVVKRVIRRAEWSAGYWDEQTAVMSGKQKADQ